MGDSAYSFSLTTFSPTGKLLQIEHALNAVNKRGKTSLGIRAVNGVVLATNRKVPALVDPGSFSKIAKVTDSVGVVYSGLGPDSRVLLKRARKQAQAYYRQYLDPIPTVSAGRRAGGGAQVLCRGTPQMDAVRERRAGPCAWTTCAARGPAQAHGRTAQGLGLALVWARLGPVRLGGPPSQDRAGYPALRASRVGKTTYLFACACACLGLLAVLPARSCAMRVLLANNPHSPSSHAARRR